MGRASGFRLGRKVGRSSNRLPDAEQNLTGPRTEVSLLRKILVTPRTTPTIWLSTIYAEQEGSPLSLQVKVTFCWVKRWTEPKERESLRDTWRSSGRAGSCHEESRGTCDVLQSPAVWRDATGSSEGSWV